jgi:hypothetical protein
MSEEVPVLIPAPTIEPTPSCNNASLNNIFNMLVELIKKNKMMTLLICVLIGVVIYYFIKVRPFKGSAFTHDHENYHHHQQPHQHSHQQQPIPQEQVASQIKSQNEQAQQQEISQEDLLKKAFPRFDEVSPEEASIKITRNDVRQLPNDLIQNPLEQVKQPINVLNDVDDSDSYDIVPENGMKLDLKARTN